MITTVAELLGALVSYERAKLDKFKLKHAPTIGKMYEGLTADILDRAIPPQLGLRLVSGFVYHDEQSDTSGEIDCMLVKGVGVPIPYTDKFKWHIANVLAVLEVKKRLRSAELLDSFLHLRVVLNSYMRYVGQAQSGELVNIPRVPRAFAEATGRIPPGYSEIGSLPPTEEAIFRTLMIEHASPLRIVFGYHGYKSEWSFRKAMLGILAKNINAHGFGVVSLPQLIIAGHYSLLKATGQPYSGPCRDGWWNFYMSTQANPLLLLLELIWTRLEQVHGIALPWGEDLETESCNPFLSGRIMQQGLRSGWEYTHVSIPKKQLEQLYQPTEWQPAFLSQPAFEVVNWLCIKGRIRIEDDYLGAVARSHGLTPDALVDLLLRSGLVGSDGVGIELITEKCECAILPTGEFIAGENNTGRLTRWVLRRLAGNGGSSPTPAGS